MSLVLEEGGADQGAEGAQPPAAWRDFNPFISVPSLVSVTIWHSHGCLGGICAYRSLCVTLALKRFLVVFNLPRPEMTCF